MIYIFFLLKFKFVVSKCGFEAIRRLWGVPKYHTNRFWKSKCQLNFLEHRRFGGESNCEIVSSRFVSFRSCVRSCARSGCLVECEPQSGNLPFPFSLMPFRASHFPFPPPPNLLSNFSWAYLSFSRFSVSKLRSHKYSNSTWELSRRLTYNSFLYYSIRNQNRLFFHLSLKSKKA